MNIVQQAEKSFKVGIIDSIKEYPHDYLIILAVFGLGILAVMGWHWTDLAKHGFWSTFWVVVAIAAGLTWVVGWVILKVKQTAKDKAFAAAHQALLAEHEALKAQVASLGAAKPAQS